MSKKAFTLVELLAAIVIVAILSGIGVVSYRSVFKTAEERYYNTIESNVLLAGNDYFEDHRSELPVGEEYSEVLLSTLIDAKYIEDVKDTEGKVCRNGSVFAYRENNKFKYEACLFECGNYTSNGKYCGEIVSRVIEIHGKKKGSSTYDYDPLRSYNSQKYSEGKNIVVTLKMEDAYPVTKYVAINTKDSNIAPYCTNISNNSCDIEIDRSGTYRVVAYDSDNKEISSRYINIKIASGKPSFTLDNLEKYQISETECSSNKTTKKIVINIIKEKNEEYKSVKYQINDEEFESLSNLRIEKELESGHYDISVVVENYNNEEELYTTSFDITYLIELEYEDGDASGTHEVVKGQNYNFITALPESKLSYGQDIDIKWYKAGSRIYPTNIINDSCSFKIVGKTAVPVTVEDFSTYCKNADGTKYTGGEQTLTNTAPTNVEFVNNKGTNIGTYTVLARIETPQYIWSDGTSADKPFTCKIIKGDNTIQVTDNQSWETSYGTSAQTKTITPATNAQGTVTYSINSQPSGNYFTISGTTLTMKANTPTGTYNIVIRATAAGNTNYNSGYKDINMTIAVGTHTNPMTVTSPQTWDATFSTSAQTKTLTAPTNAQGTVTYSISSQPSGNYFTISGSTLTMKANTPIGSYEVKVKVSAAGNTNYAAGEQVITMNVTVGGQACNAPTNLAVSAAGAITWTESSNCSGGTYQVKVGDGSYVTATSGVNKHSDIISVAGTRQICVKAIKLNDNYTDSSETCINKSVYTVTLTKGTGVSSVSGAGKYISGETVTLGSTMNSGYSWSKWTQTSGGSQVSTTNAYSAAITSNWSYTATAQANTYTLNYSDNLFAARTQSTNGVVATYTESGSYLTLNGTLNTTGISELWNLERRSFAANDQYKITIIYISGSLTCADSSNCTGSAGRPHFVFDLTKDGSSLSDRGTSPISFIDINLPTSGTTEGTFTVASNRTGSNGLKYWIWQKTANNAVFSNYKVQIIITKVHSKSVTYNGTYGTLDTPSKTGYTFDGWYTALTGGSKVTSSTTYSLTENETLYARYTSHKLIIQYNGNGSDVTWCSTNANYSMNSDKYEVRSSSIDVQKVGYGQYVSYSAGLDNYNNQSYTCFAKSGYTAKTGAEWILNGTSNTYGHDDATVTAIGIASDAGCNLAANATCTARMNVNWKSANTIAVTASQSWSATFGTGNQDKSFTAATGAQGTVTYAIQSQKNSSGTAVSSFSIPTNTTATLRMAGSTAVGTYTVVIRATAAGNGNYNSGYKDITMTVTVGKAGNPIAVTASQSWNPAFSTSAQTKAITAASGGQGTVTYAIQSQKNSSGTAVSNFTISGTTLTMAANTGPGTYTVVIRATAAGNGNYNSGYKDITMTVTVSQATNTVTITKKTYTWDGNGKSTTATATSGTPSITYYSDSSCATQTTTTNATSAGGTPKIAGTYYAKATVAASTNYLAGNSGCKEAVVISQATPTVSLTAKTGTWSGSVITANTATVSPNSSPSISYTYYTDSSCATKTSTSHGASAAGGAPSLGGQYYVKASAAAVSGKTNAATSSCVSHKINVATPTVSLSAKTGTWSGSAIAANAASVSPNSSPSITYTYYTNSSCSTKTTTSHGASAAGGAPSLGGQYYVKASAAAVTNKTAAASSGCVSHKINVATPTVSLSAKTGTWSGSAIAANAASVSPNSSPTITYTYYTNSTCSAGATTTAPTTVGQYYVKASAAAVTNKTAAASSGCVSHKINKATAKAPTLTGGTFTYNGANQCISKSGGTSGLTVKYAWCNTSNGTSCSGSWSAWGDSASYYCGTNVGKWLMKAYVVGNSNYNDSAASNTVVLTINKATAAAPTLTGGTFTYNGANQCISKSGGTSGLTVKYAWCNTSNGTSCSNSWSSWGEYASNACGAGVGKWLMKAYTVGNSNYNDSAASNTVVLTINKATAAAPTLTGGTYTADGTDHCITKSGGTSGLTVEYAWRNVGGSWSSWGTSTSYYCGTSAGTWEMKARTVGNSNYNTSADSNVVTLKINNPTYYNWRVICNCVGAWYYVYGSGGPWTSEAAANTNCTNNRASMCRSKCDAVRYKYDAVEGCYVYTV